MQMQIGLRQKLETCKTLPSLPAVAVHVLRLCQRENFDIADVARAIGSDHTLAAKVVRLVNTPLFTLRQEVKTVSQALMLLGVNSVRTIALAFAVVAEMRAHERPGFDRRNYWKRAVIAATVAQDLSRIVGLRHAEDSFLGALLQDVGEVALEQAASDVYQPLFAEARADHDKLVALEVQAFGCDHAEVGRWLMTQLRMPDVVRAAVGSSHDPSRWQRGSDPATESTVKVVALSGVVADIWVMPDAAVAARKAFPRAKEILGIEGDRLLGLIRRVNKSIGDVAPLFDIPVATPEEAEAIAERAEYGFRNPNGGPDEAVPSTIQAEAVDETAQTDPLTGLASRAHFDAYLAQEFELASKIGKPLSVIIGDPDHLDMINQTFGRDAGDRALQALGTLIGERLRYRDLAARYGGEEFALVLTDTHAAGAATLAERLRKKVEDAHHEIGIGDPVRMTISFGCVTLDEALAFPSSADLLRAAEETLAEAKRAGRNRVMSFSTFNVAA